MLGGGSDVRGSSRRITTMKASASSILEYQSDQPSMKLLGPLSILLPFTTGKDEPPHFSLAGSFHISRSGRRASRGWKKSLQQVYRRGRPETNCLVAPTGEDGGDIHMASGGAGAGGTETHIAGARAGVDRGETRLGPARVRRTGRQSQIGGTRGGQT
jgi:hypothetical protein